MSDKRSAFVFLVNSMDCGRPCLNWFLAINLSFYDSSHSSEEEHWTSNPRVEGSNPPGCFAFFYPQDAFLIGVQNKKLRYKAVTSLQNKKNRKMYIF